MRVACAALSAAVSSLGSPHRCDRHPQLSGGDACLACSHISCLISRYCRKPIQAFSCYPGPPSQPPIPHSQLHNHLCTFNHPHTFTHPPSHHPLSQAPDADSLERFLGALPLVMNVVIMSPHGYFGQSNVLGLPDTGGQVGDLVGVGKATMCACRCVWMGRWHV
jgi:hypothetical protein